MTFLCFLINAKMKIISVSIGFQINFNILKYKMK